MTVQDFLFYGAEQAQTAGELCKIIHCNKRELSIWIERERKAGAPICASVTEPKGYYLAATPDEMAAYCKSLRRRYNQIGGTLTACEHTADTMERGGANG